VAGRIFISYRRRTDSGSAGRLYDRLVQRFPSDDVFMDVVKIGAGTDYAEELKARIAACDVLLAVIGPAWLEILSDDGARRLDNPDDWVRTEIATGLAYGKVVIPVLVDGARLPKADSLPKDLEDMTRLHTAHLAHDTFGDDVARLCANIDDKFAQAARRKQAEDEARAAQADAGHPLSPQDVTRRYHEAVFPEFGVRVMPRMPHLPERLAPQERMFCFCGDLAEYRGRFLGDIHRDMFVAPPEPEVAYIAIKFRIDPTRLAEFEVLPARASAMCHLLGDYVELVGEDRIDDPNERARHRFARIEREATVGFQRRTFAFLERFVLSGSLRPEIEQRYGRPSGGLMDYNRLLQRAFGFDMCCLDPPRGPSAFAARHFLVRNLPLADMDIEVQHLGRADDLRLLT
jgi:hypothetical protein